MLTSCEWGAYFLAISHVFVTILGRFAHTAYENSQTYQNWKSVIARGGIEPGPRILDSSSGLSFKTTRIDNDLILFSI